jgi:hypothetical protein
MTENPPACFVAVYWKMLFSGADRSKTFGNELEGNDRKDLSG